MQDVDFDGYSAEVNADEEFDSGWKNHRLEKLKKSKRRHNTKYKTLNLYNQLSDYNTHFFSIWIRDNDKEDSVKTNRIKRYKNSNAQRFRKNQSNRAFRRNKYAENGKGRRYIKYEENGRGCRYRKYFDFWWWI